MDPVALLVESDTRAALCNDIKNQTRALREAVRPPELLECLEEAKRRLDELPVAQTIEETSPDELTPTLLAYALKLAKFTKLPQGMDGALHPSNFIFPGDDSLRRGGLAMMADAKIGKEIVVLENGAELETKLEVSQHALEKMDVDQADDLLPERNVIVDEEKPPTKKDILQGLNFDTDSDSDED